MHLIFARAERKALSCHQQHSSCICALESSCEKCGSISIIACCFLVLRKPPSALITLSGVPFANGLSSPAVGIGRPSAAEGSSSGERNNSCRGKRGSKTKSNANHTLLRDMHRCRMLLGSRQAQAYFWQELTGELLQSTASSLPILEDEGDRERCPGPCPAQRGACPQAQRGVGLAHPMVPFPILCACTKTSGCRRGMIARDIAGQGTLALLLGLQGMELGQGPAPSCRQNQNKLTK